jgi:anaphase-promoting complex subunit 2
LEELQRLLAAALRARLLHAGAPTADILRTYMLCIHVLRLVDPSGVTLDRISGPVRAYLVQRPDTIRCIVQSLTDPAGDLFAELCKAPAEPGGLRGPAGAESAEDWTPEPADALPQGEGVSRHKDVVELLVKIFGGSEAFVGEFKVS